MFLLKGDNVGEQLIYMSSLLIRFVRSRWLDNFFFFFCVLMDRDGVEVHKLAKKRTMPISSHLDRTSLVKKGFTVTWLSGKFFLRFTAGSPERARKLNLARSGTQSQPAIWVILSTRGASHIHAYGSCARSTSRSQNLAVLPKLHDNSLSLRT